MKTGEPALHEKETEAPRPTTAATLDGLPESYVPGRRFQRGTLWPFLAAFGLTFLPTLGLLIYLLRVRVATFGQSCDGNDAANACGILGDVQLNGRTLILEESVGRFLTVTKMVDTIQGLAITFVLALAAFPIAELWIAESSLTTHTLSLVTNMYASGRWWSIVEAVRSFFQRDTKPSKAFVQAFSVLLVALGISRIATAADLWLHFVTKEAPFVLAATTATTASALLAPQKWGRAVNMSCNPPGQYHSPLAPCLINPSALGGGILSWPAAALSLATNASSTDSVQLVFEPVMSANTTGNYSIPTATALVLPANSSASVGKGYNATTIGVTASCHAISQACGLLNLAHGTGSFNCTRIGYNWTEYFSNPSPGVVLTYQPYVNTTGNTVELLSLLGIVSGNGSAFQSSGYTTSSAILEACQLQAWSVDYEGLNYRDASSLSTTRILARRALSPEQTESMLAVVTSSQQPLDDALSAARGAAQTSAERFSTTLSYELARFALAYAANGWYASDTAQIRELPVAKTYTIVPLAPMAMFFGTVFAYVLLILALFIYAARSGGLAIRHRSRPLSARSSDDDGSPERLGGGGSAADNDAAADADAHVSLTELVQCRLVRTDFLLYQLLSPDGTRSTQTDADDVMRRENDTLVVADYVDGRFGLWATRQDPAGHAEQTLAQRQKSLRKLRSSTRRTGSVARRKRAGASATASGREGADADTDADLDERDIEGGQSEPIFGANPPLSWMRRRSSTATLAHSNAGSAYGSHVGPSRLSMSTNAHPMPQPAHLQRPGVANAGASTDSLQPSPLSQDLSRQLSITETPVDGVYAHNWPLPQK